MRMLRCQDGAALVTALMLTMLSLVIAMALLSSVIMETRISASQKRYRSALAAARGGVELLTQEIIPGVSDSSAPDGLEETFRMTGLDLPQYACLKQKLDNPPDAWSACSTAQSSSDPAESPDMTFRLSGQTDIGFRVSTKIVDTVPGNSDRHGNDLLDPGDSVAGGEERVIRPQHVPAMYNLSVQGVREGAEAREKARLSVLYAY